MLNPDYIVGLVDGEGSFTVYIRNPDEAKIVKRRVRAEPKFMLKLIERDKSILYELKQYFGCGHVYFQKDSRMNHQNCYRFEISNRKDLERVVMPFFKKHSLRLISKRRDFEIFCDILKRIKRNEHLTKEGMRKLYQIKHTMH